MRCPKCNHEKQRVLESRPFGEETYRKRLCLNCDQAFITYEKVSDVNTVYIPRVKRKGKDDA